MNLILMTTFWLRAADGGSTGQPFSLESLIPVLGVSVVFIYVWMMERKETKAANAALLANEKAHSEAMSEREKAHSEAMIESERAHSAQLLELVNRMAPVLENATDTLGAMEKGAAYVAEQVASSHQVEYRGLRDELRRVAQQLDDKGI